MINLKNSPNLASQKTARNLKILLSAYACEPNRGSEPGVGWNTARELAQYHQIWVLTSNTHRPLIDAELAQHPVENLHFVYLDPLGWVYDWSQEGKRSQWNVQIHYYLWQILAYFVARRLHPSIQFDLAHHVTYVKYSSPSFLSLLPIPFIWGPVGGAESAPLSFWQGFTLRSKVYETAREIARRLGELDPFVYLTARRSVLSWATTEDTAQGLRRIGAKEVRLLSQLGLNAAEIETLTTHASLSQRPVRFISVGRLLHWKGFDLGLQAFAQAKLAPAEYWIIGDGPEQARLEALADQLGIAHQVKFWQKLPRPEILQRLGECLALVHPSLHDSGGLVCLEAMAAGCPVICLDLGGPGVQVTAETGIKVSAQTPAQAIRDLAAAMDRIAHQPQLQQQLSTAGQRHIKQHFSWSEKAKALSAEYQQILASLQ